MTDNSCDVAVIGAGAAGVAAARRLHQAGREILVLEARDRVGGRAWTVPTGAGHPVDLGCEWLHSADTNPWTGIARTLGFAIDETLPDWGQRVAWHAGAAAQGDWLAARDAFDERCAAAAAGPGPDRAEAALLEPGNRWNPLLGAISTWANGTEPERVSVRDHALYENSGVNWRALRGYGALINAYAAALPIRLGTVVERIDHCGTTLAIHTNRGTLSANAAILTVPTSILAAEAIRFAPALPDVVAAAAGLPLGVANKIFLAVEGRAEDLPRDRHLVGSTARVATGGYQIRPHGWPVVGGYFGGACATALEREGPAGMAAFAIDELAELLGSDFRRRLKPLASSAWVSDPFARGSYSCALPGHADDRAVLARPIADRLHYAGEACPKDSFGTAHAAFGAGVAAAERILGG